jgi:2-C-methyl-D-erythritol 2,4-cyclodiphosphate synthase
MFRIGHGFDIHKFEEEKPLVLGGVSIPYSRGMKGHSDGDVVIHALCDAILGAAALGDIGRHFPDTDPRHKNQNSRDFLRHVVHLIHQKDYQISNADVSIIAQVPKLAPFIEQMCIFLSQDLKVSVADVNVKATTMEGLGPIGQEQAIAAHAVVLLSAS